MRAMVRGMVPIVLDEVLLRRPHRYALAADLGEVVYYWRNDGDDVWTAVSVFISEDGEGHQILW
jgi:hypothetical protein